jgi:hypothetical protein
MAGLEGSNPLHAPRCLVLSLAVSLLALSPAHAVDKSGSFAPKGMGFDTCKSLVDAVQKKDQKGLIVFIGWLEGFLTAVNMLQSGIYDIAPWQSPDTLLKMVASHCEQNGDEHLAEVALKLAEYLGKDRLTERSQVEEAKVGKDTVQIYTEVLRRVQQQLVDGGYLSGTADGNFGPKTQTALEAYQTKQGLPKTGLPDQPTLVQMFVRRASPPQASAKPGAAAKPAPAAANPAPLSGAPPKLDLNLGSGLQGLQQPK